MCSVHFFPLLLVLAAGAIWQRPSDKLRWCLALLAAFFLGDGYGVDVSGAGLALRLAAAHAIFPPCRDFSLLLRFLRDSLALVASRDFRGTALHENKTWNRLAVSLLPGHGRGHRDFHLCLRHRTAEPWRARISGHGRHSPVGRVAGGRSCHSRRAVERAPPSEGES